MTLLRQHHINTDNVDWDIITEEANRRLTGTHSTRSAYGAIQFVIDSLGERHTSLRSPLRRASPYSSAPRPPLELPAGEFLGGRIGKVTLPSLMASQEEQAQYEVALREALLALGARGVCGWIVDLRSNGGGSMWPMLRGLDPLLGAAPLGSFKSRTGLTHWSRTACGLRPTPYPQEAVPSFRLNGATAPAAVLLGPSTASSGEMVGVALIGRPGVRSFGEPTAGLSTANRTHLLLDGSRLSITTSRVRDRTGREYTGPVVPDEEIVAQDASEAAQRWISAQGCKEEAVPTR